MGNNRDSDGALQEKRQVEILIEINIDDVQPLLAFLANTATPLQLLFQDTTRELPIAALIKSVYVEGNNPNVNGAGKSYPDEF